MNNKLSLCLFLFFVCFFPFVSPVELSKEERLKKFYTMDEKIDLRNKDKKQNNMSIKEKMEMVANQIASRQLGKPTNASDSLLAAQEREFEAKRLKSQQETEKGNSDSVTSSTSSTSSTTSTSTITQTYKPNPKVLSKPERRYLFDRPEFDLCPNYPLSDFRIDLEKCSMNLPNTTRSDFEQKFCLIIFVNLELVCSIKEEEKGHSKDLKSEIDNFESEQICDFLDRNKVRFDSNSKFTSVSSETLGYYESDVKDVFGNEKSCLAFCWSNSVHPLCKHALFTSKVLLASSNFQDMLIKPDSDKTGAEKVDNLEDEDEDFPDKQVEVPEKDQQEEPKTYVAKETDEKKPDLPMEDPLRKFDDSIEKQSHFFSYFVVIVIMCIVFYLLFHNKQKILALILEGRGGRRSNGRRGRNSSSAQYRKLDNNLEEMGTNSSESVRDIIY